MRWWFLFAWLLGCLAVGAVGSRWSTPEIANWYRALRKPGFNPPNWLFAPVWTTLYVLMGIAAWRVAEAESSPARTLGLILFLVQLGLNLAWSWIFFRKHALGAALAELAAMWVAVAAALTVFTQVDAASAWLMAPYLGWLSFAAVLNLALWRLNEDTDRPLARTASRD